MRYLNIYMLWLSTIFNIILPIIALVLLNTFITRFKLSVIFIRGCPHITSSAGEMPAMADDG